MQNGAVSGLVSPPPLFFSLFSSFLPVIQRVEEKEEEEEEEEEGRGVCVYVRGGVQIVTELDKFPTREQYKSSDYSSVIALAARRAKSMLISVR